MKHRLLIIGGSGLLGVNWALQMRNQFEIFLHLHRRKIYLNDTICIQSEITDSHGIKNLLDELRPDIVINSSGLTNIEYCEAFPDLANLVNVKIAESVSRECYSRNIQFVQISTDHLFSGDSELLSEEASPQPLNIYAETKAAAELAVARVNPHALIIRTNFFGWGPSYRQSFSDWIIQSLRDSKKLTLFEDVYFTPILAEQLILNIHALLEQNVFGVFNVVSSERISKFEFGRMLAHEFNLNEKLVFSGSINANSALVLRPSDMSLSNKKLILQNGPGSVSSLAEQIKMLFDQERSGNFNEIINL